MGMTSYEVVYNKPPPALPSIPLELVEMKQLILKCPTEKFYLQSCILSYWKLKILWRFMLIRGVFSILLMLETYVSIIKFYWFAHEF